MSDLQAWGASPSVAWQLSAVCTSRSACLQDCPNHAVLVDVAAALSLANTGAVSDALCIFEDDLSTTAWRHRDTSEC
jgi:Copper amine oxidase, enzyme domain